MTPQGVSLRFSSTEDEFTAESTEGEVSVSIDVNPFHIAEMFNWLYIVLFRLQTIKNTMDAVEPDIRRRVEKMVDDAFSNKCGSLRDMDGVNFQVQYHTNQDRAQAEPAEGTKTVAEKKQCTRR